MGEHGFKLIESGGLEHGDTCWAEIGYAFEERRRGKVAADMQYAPVLVDALYALMNLAAEQGEFFGYRNNGLYASMQEAGHFSEYPRGADRGAAHHDAVDTGALKSLDKAFGSGNVAVADNRYMQSRVGFYPGDFVPVGFAGIHLRTGASVDCDCLYSAVLKLFGEVYNDF